MTVFVSLYTRRAILPCLGRKLSAVTLSHTTILDKFCFRIFPGIVLCLLITALYKILKTLGPPPASILLFSVKSLRRNMYICEKTLILGKGLHISAYILSVIVDVLIRFICHLSTYPAIPSVPGRSCYLSRKLATLASSNL